MDMELQRTCLDGFQTILDQTVIQEETLESIVPDACPDIQRIVDTDGEVCMRTRELSEGSLRVGGSIRATVIYIPDGEPGARRMEVRIPFVCSVDDSRLRSDGRLVAAPRLCRVDARIVNPRKVLVRAELAVAVQVMVPEQLEVCTGACDVSENGLQQRREERSTYRVTAVTEKTFTFSDVLSLSASRPRVEELLRSRMELRSLDAKVIGSKLILKGEATLRCLCRSEEGALNAVQFELPYSQILELSGVQEGADVTVVPVLAASECVLQPGDPGSLAVSLEIVAQAVVREAQTMTVVSDLYCTQCPVEVDREELSLSRLMDLGAQRQAVRQFCPWDVPVKEVLDCGLWVGRTAKRKEDSGMVVTANTTVCVLFLSEDDALCAASFPVEAEAALPVNGETELFFSCLGSGELTAAPVTGGLEVRFTVEFPYLALERTRCGALTGLRPLPVEEGSGPKPSVILRVVGEKEALWDIAKACSATVEDIMTANQLESESAPAGMLLLIPKQRQGGN